jgi:hypothetical protein
MSEATTILPELVQFEEEGTWEQPYLSTNPDGEEWHGTGWRVRDYIGTLYFRHKERDEVKRWLIKNGYTDTGDGAHYRRVMILCEGCGYEYPENEMASDTTEVNLKDGSTRNIRFCGNTCADIWDNTSPGDWITLHAGEYVDPVEVQLVLWRCIVCDGLYNFDVVKLLIDTEYIDTSEPINFQRDAYTVCGFCQQKEPGRYLTKEESILAGGDEVNLSDEYLNYRDYPQGEN